MARDLLPTAGAAARQSDDLDADALIASARDLADRLFGGMGRRWLHTKGVARRAAIVAASLPVEDRPALVAAAWLHDIDHAEPLKRTRSHPLDGTCFLLETGWGAPVPGLVAHHSGARFAAAVRGLSPLMHRFRQEEHAIGTLAEALVYADQTTGPDGRALTVEDRFADMLDRHGPNSPQAQVHGRRAPAICSAIRRTERRLLAAGVESDASSS